jgi:ribosomal protein S18 acetylase RimI-like enzyme
VSLEIRPLAEGDRGWVAATIRERWAADVVVAHGVVYHPAELEGFIALDGPRPVGLLTFVREGDALEIVTVDAFEPRRGVGRALVDAVAALGAERVWLVTTNDNVTAQGFYEALGFRLVTVREGELERSRALKPEIPAFADDGTPIRDELEYERRR